MDPTKRNLELVPYNDDSIPVSVIVCAYTEERWDDLVKAMQYVGEQSHSPDEIILVIDHNPQMLERAVHTFPKVHVIQNKEARGLSGARNSGVKAAQGGILVFIDDDAWPEPDWLARLLEAYTDLSVLGAGGAIEPEWEGNRPAWFPREFDWVVGCTYKGMPTENSTVRNLIGANMSFRCSVFETAGAFAHEIGRVGKFPAGCEETEISIRAKQLIPEGKLLYIPAARVHHRVPLNRSRWAYFSHRCYAEGLSKALVTYLVGTRDGLDTERAYALHTLPIGVMRGLEQTIRGDIHGLQRALAIIAGLFLTSAGYLIGKLRLPGAGNRAFKGHLQNTRQQKNLTSTSQGEEGIFSERIGGQ